MLESQPFKRLGFLMSGSLWVALATGVCLPPRPCPRPPPRSQALLCGLARLRLWLGFWLEVVNAPAVPPAGPCLQRPQCSHLRNGVGGGCGGLRVSLGAVLQINKETHSQSAN